MHKTAHYNLAATALLLACVASTLARGAENMPAGNTTADKPRVVVLCPECGIVSHIRRIDKPVAPERNLLPNITSSPHAGGIGNETQAVPLFTIGRGGAQRVHSEPATRSVWEVTVRYDNGQYGFVNHDLEPDLKVGDRVRHVENTLEAIPQAAR